MATEVFDVDCQKALAAATAVEVFHNFSLIHDDIMDEPNFETLASSSPTKEKLSSSLVSPKADMKEKILPVILKQLENKVKPPNTFPTARTLVPYIKQMVTLFPQSIVKALKIPSNISDRTSMRELRRIEADIHTKVLELTTANMYDLMQHGGGGARKGGRGLHRMHGRGLSNPDEILQTDFSQGIMPTQKYVPFGRYFIDHHRINDDIISLRRGNGVNIFGLPVRRVTKDLGEVVRTILKNGHPSYNQIDKLTKE
jgi:hypothetical protein